VAGGRDGDVEGVKSILRIIQKTKMDKLHFLLVIMDAPPVSVRC